MPEQPRAAQAGWDPRIALCTWFGTGLLRPAPGTWASVGAGLIALVLLSTTPAAAWHPALLLACLGATVAGVGFAPVAIRYFRVSDPGQVVIDEVAGVWLTLACLPNYVLAHPVLAISVGVALFRVFDIAKPWPVCWCEHLPRGWGIMADDLVAGVLAGCLAAVVLG